MRGRATASDLRAVDRFAEGLRRANRGGTRCTKCVAYDPHCETCDGTGYHRTGLVRALTLHPHWAHAVAWLGKRCENRKTRIPRELLGTCVAIHAGARVPHARWYEDLAQVAERAGERVTVLPARSGTPGRFHDTCTNHAEPDSLTIARPIVKRAIVATAVLCEETEAPHMLDGKPWKKWGDPDAPVWWRLGFVRRLVEPIPVQRGQLGLWGLNSKVTGPLYMARTVAA